jgi:aromatic ring-opening dioxygenase catalytic subunit (LigB family)
MLLWPEKHPITFGDIAMIGGPNGPHAAFLKDLGKHIVEKLKPKALLVFSAHWETRNQIEGTFLLPSSSIF